MAEKIKIAELSLDDKALIKSLSETKKNIDQLKKSQAELKKTGNGASELFVEQASELKALNKEYNAGVKVLADRTKAISDLEAREQLLNVALNTEVDTIAAAREQNKLLNELRNTAVTTLGEQSEEVQKLNAKLDENNEFIKANADAYLKQKINIGNYKESIKEAFDEINIFNGGLGGFIARSKEAGGVGALVASSFKAMTSGLIGLTKAALSFIATPIGAVLAAIVAAFALVRNALNRNEESVNKLKKAFAPFIGIVNGVLKALEPLGEFLIDGIAKAFEFVEKAVFSALDALSTALEFLGFEETAASLKGFNNGLKESAENSKALAQAQSEYEKEQRKANKTQLDYQRQAEKLRQIRDDENLTIRERIAANEELGVVLKKQLEEELRIANIALEVANLRLESEGRTSELLDAQAEALERVADIQERITGQESEQLVNRVALQKEAADKAKELADRAIAEQESQLELFIQQQGVRAKSLQEQLDIAREVYRREVEILEANLKNRNLTQTQYDAELLALKNDLIKQQSDLAIQEGNRELQLYIENNQSKIDNEKFFTELALQEEIRRQELIAQKREEFAALQFEKGVINEQQYQDELTRIQNDIRLQREEAEKQREEAEKEKRLIDRENQLQIDEELFQEDLAIRLERLELQRQQELEQAEKTGADIALINQKYALAEEALRKQTELAKIGSTQDALGDINTIISSAFGEQKELSFILATIDTVLGAQKAYLSQLVPGDPSSLLRAGLAAAAAGAAGAARVAQIAGVKFEKGGISEIHGASHAGGGVPIYAGNQYIGEAEGGEGIGILNRAAFSGFMDFNNSFLSGRSSGGRFEGGGIITQAVRPSEVGSTEQMLNAISQMKVQVAVEDINDGQGSYADVVNSANL